MHVLGEKILQYYNLDIKNTVEAAIALKHTQEKKLKIQVYLCE